MLRPPRPRSARTLARLIGHLFDNTTQISYPDSSDSVKSKSGRSFPNPDMCRLCTLRRHPTGDEYLY